MSTSSTSHDYDLIVIGGGSGGVRAARMAAGRGARVALVESGAMGGTCVNVGCVPKKMYSYGAQHGENLALARGYGWQVPEGITLDWAHLKRVRGAEIARLNTIYEGLMTGAKVERLAGHASLDEAGRDGLHTVHVALTVGGTQTLRAKQVLIATGGRPFMPRLPGIELAVNSDAGLTYIGRAGSGFTDRGLSDALAKLAPLERATPPLDGVPRLDARDAHWVEPRLVGEVSFTEWTSAGTLRHPVWRGWRPDKSPDAVVREGVVPGSSA